MKTTSKFAAMFAAAALTVVPAAAQVGPPHFNDANQLVTDLLSNPANVNLYDGDGSLTDVIQWTGNPRTAISVCGTFMTMLLKHSYGLTNAQFTARTGSTSPNAAKYYDAIAANSGFTRIAAPDQWQPGDVIAIKYPAGSNSSGHVMMVQAVGAYQQRFQSNQNFLQNGGEANVAGYYDVTVIDSSASYHGSTDTRYSKPGGIGRNGIARVYVDNANNVVGYTWSTVKSSEYRKAADGYVLATGRIVVANW